MKELRLAFIGFGSANQALARMLLEKSEPGGCDQKRYLRIGKRLVVRYMEVSFLCSYHHIQNLTVFLTCHSRGELFVLLPDGMVVYVHRWMVMQSMKLIWSWLWRKWNLGTCSIIPSYLQRDLPYGERQTHY